jgi:hypothetical protein
MQWLQDHWPTIQTLLVNAAASIVSALAAVGISYRVFGEKLVGHFFDRRLEVFKHEQTVELEQIRHDRNQEIENLKAQIGHIADRGKHSNEREYTAISAIWENVVDLYYATNLCVVSFIQFPSLNSMPDDEVSEFLNTTEFSAEQKKAVLAAKDKERSFSHITARRYINAAQVKYYEMNLSLHKLGIFIPRELKLQFDEFGKMCASAIAQRYTEHGNAFRTGLNFESDFLSNGEKRLEALKDAVRNRLMLEL